MGSPEDVPGSLRRRTMVSGVKDIVDFAYDLSTKIPVAGYFINLLRGPYEGISDAGLYLYQMLDSPYAFWGPDSDMGEWLKEGLVYGAAYLGKKTPLRNLPASTLASLLTEKMYRDRKEELLRKKREKELESR